MGGGVIDYATKHTVDVSQKSLLSKCMIRTNIQMDQRASFFPIAYTHSPLTNYSSVRFVYQYYIRVPVFPLETSPRIIFYYFSVDLCIVISPLPACRSGLPGGLLVCSLSVSPSARPSVRPSVSLSHFSFPDLSLLSFQILTSN